MACECGAFKTYKAKEKDRAHSDWCPWSPIAKNHKCENLISTPIGNWAGYTTSYAVSCKNTADRWVCYSKGGAKMYYCYSCWMDISVGSVSVFDWGEV